MNVYHDDNHEYVQLFDEIVYVRQPWRYATLGYNLPKISAFTPITISIGFQNRPPHTNINLVSINSEMEQFHLLNRLEQLCHINRKSSNQSISIPYLEPIEPKATPTIV
jgi:hypothetical protein